MRILSGSGNEAKISQIIHTFWNFAGLRREGEILVNRKTSNICASQFKLETHSVKILEVQEQKVFRGCMCILGSCLIFLLLLRCCCVWLSCTAPAPRAASFPEPSREQTPGGAFAPQRGRLCRALHTGEARPLHQPSLNPTSTWYPHVPKYTDLLSFYPSLRCWRPVLALVVAINN